MTNEPGTGREDGSLRTEAPYYPPGDDTSALALGRRRIGGVSRYVFLLGVVSLFADLAGEMIYPLVPIFLTVTLGAPPEILGVVEGVAESAASLLRVVSGWISDRIGRRKPLVLLGYGLGALGKPLLAIAFSWWFVLGARFVDRVGKGIRGAPRDALIAEWSPPAERGRAFGFHRMMDTMGAIGGPLIALAALALLENNLRLLFFIAFIPGIAAVLFVLPVRDRPTPPTHRPPPISFRLAGYSREYKAFLLVALVFALGNSSDAFLILRAKDVGLSTTSVVLAYVLYNVVYAASALPAGIVSDIAGRRNVILAGFAIFAAVYLGFAMVENALMVWVLFAIYGAYIALTDGVARALVVDLVPRDRSATALGLYNTVAGLMVLVASVTAGFLWDRVSPAAPFIYGAGTAALAALLLLLLLPRHVRAD